MSDILSTEQYLCLYQLFVKLPEADGNKLNTVLNDNECCNWTVCPVCRIDDFTHSESCRLDNSLDASGDVK